MKRKFKRLLGILLAVALCVGLIPSALAVYSSSEATAAAEKLASLRLFVGTSGGAANPQFELDREPTRAEALVIIVRLLGMEDTVLNPDGDWASAPSPFTDVSGWAVPYAAFCYASGYVKGVGDNKYNPEAPVSASEMLTIILRALGYKDGVDFKWDSAWTLSDKTGLTSGEFNAAHKAIIRGEIALVLLEALYQPVGSSGKTLLKTLMDNAAVSSVTEELVKAAGLEDALVMPIEDIEETPDVPLSELPTGSQSSNTGGGGGGGYTPPPDSAPATALFVGSYTVDGVNFVLLSAPSGYTGAYTLDGQSVTASNVLTNADGSKLVKIIVPDDGGTVAASGGFSRAVTFGTVGEEAPAMLYGTVPMTFSVFFHDVTGNDVPNAPAATSFAAGGTVAAPIKFITQGTRTGNNGTVTYAVGDAMEKVDAVSSATYGDSVHFVPTGNLTTDGSPVTSNTDPDAAITGIKKVEVGVSFDLYANAKLLSLANRATAQSANVLAAVSDFEISAKYYADDTILDADGDDAADLGVYKVKYLLTDGNWGARIDPTAGAAMTPKASPDTGAIGATAPTSYGGNWADKQVTYNFGGSLGDYAGQAYWNDYFEYAYGGYITDENGHTEPLVFLQSLFSHRGHTNLDVAISPYRFSRHADLAVSGTFEVTVFVYGFEDVVFTVELADYTNGGVAADKTSISLTRSETAPTVITISGVERYDETQAALKRGTEVVEAEKYSLDYNAEAKTVTLTLEPAFSPTTGGFGGNYTLSFIDKTAMLRSKIVAITVTDLDFRPALSSDGSGDGVAATEDEPLAVDVDGKIYIHDNAFAAALTLSNPRGAYCTFTDDEDVTAAITRVYDELADKYYMTLRS